MIDKKIKRSSHPVMFFIYLSLFVIIASGIASLLNFQVTYDKLTTIAGEVESTTIAVNSLLSLDGLKFIISSAYNNLINFEPFGNLLIASIGFAIALKSGFLKTLCNKVTKKIPKFLIVFIYSLLCIISSLDGNLGYVLLLPLGAVLFMSMNRNPLGGLALGFASIASGHGAGLFVTTLDYNLSSYTEASAKLLNDEYKVLQDGNLFFIIAAALLIALVCTLVTEKYLVRKLGRNTIEEENEIILDESKEKQGLFASLIATIIYLIPIILMIIPVGKESFLGLLLDKSQTTYSKMLFSSDSLFANNLVGIISLLFALQGFVFGVVSGTIKKIRDIVSFSSSYLKSIGSIFALIFFAAELSSILKETNFGVVITGTLANLVAASKFSFIPLVLLILLVTVISNILVPASVSKWAILAPNIMNVVMKANITPEFAQIVFRAGDSLANAITPLFPYFVIFIGFVELYTKNSNDFSIKGCCKLIFPCFLAVALVWIIMIICWFIIGLPIGPSIYPTF